MKKEIYLVNPCKASSLPFWKTNLVKIPENMKIVLEDDLQGVDILEYFDERFFKLMHHMRDIEKPLLDDKYEMILSRLVDTFSSRILYLMLLLSGNHSIAVV